MNFSSRLRLSQALPTLLLIVFVAATREPANAEQTLHFTMKRTTATRPTDQPLNAEPAKPDAKGAKGDDETGWTTTVADVDEQIVLRPQSIVILSKDNAVYYDFDKKCVRTADLNKHQFSEIDIHALVFFSEAEYHNRQMLDKLHDEILNKKFFSTFGDQSLFKIVPPGSTEKVELEIKDVDHKISYEHDGKVVATYEPSIVPVEIDSKRPYRRLLANTCTIHPLIRQSLVEKRDFPKVFMYHSVNGPFEKTTKVYTLIEDSSPAQRPLSVMPSDFKRSRFAELAPIYDALEKLGPSPKLMEKEAVSSEVDKMLKQGSTLDAMLTVTEYALASGENMESEMQRISPFVKLDPTCISFYQNIEPKSDEEAKVSIKALQNIDRSKLSRGYVIDIMCANILQQMGDMRAAKEMMIKVLIANPLIVGAYHDLGKIYLSMYQTTTAWECFRLARSLQPGHPIMKEIDEIEKKLETDFPDFF